MTIKVVYGQLPPRAAAPATTPWGWFHVPHPDPAVQEVHLLPASDSKHHAFDMQCPCHPDEESPGFITHCAFDGREAYEAGSRQTH